VQGFTEVPRNQPNSDAKILRNRALISAKNARARRFLCPEGHSDPECHLPDAIERTA
jgi:hypothetical protein